MLIVHRNASYIPALKVKRLWDHALWVEVTSNQSYSFYKDIFIQTCMLFKSMRYNPYFTNFSPLSLFVTTSSPRMGTRTGSFPLHGSTILWQCLVKLPFYRTFGEGGRLEVEKG